MKSFLLQTLLYAAVSSILAQTESGVPSTKTAATPGTKKIVSSDLPEDYHLATVSNEFDESFSSTAKTISEVVIPHPGLRSQDSSKIPPFSDNDDFIYKPQKLKKKILVSNLKNISDKIILPNDKYDKQIFLKPIVNSTEAPDEGNDVIFTKNSTTENANATVVKPEEVKSEEDARKNAVPNESRSFQENDSEETVKGLVKSKNRLTPTATDSSEEKLTTSSYMYRTFSEIQKVLNNNFLNINEAYDTSIRPKLSVETVRSFPQTTVILPGIKTTSISNDNSVKNAIRFESEFYGPTGQTDWIPIVPENISGPERSSTTKSPEKLVATTPSNRIHFPDEIKKTTQENNFIPIQNTEPEKSTRITLDKQNRVNPTSESNVIDDKTPRPGQVNRLFNKYRGTVRYRPQLNSSIIDENFSNKSKKTNASTSFSEMSLPSTGASWTLATLGGPSSTRFTRKPSSDNSTLLVKTESSSFSNQTEKSEEPNTSQERLKLDNVTKEQNQVLKNTIPDSIPTVVTPSVSKYNETKLEVENLKKWPLEVETSSKSEIKIEASTNPVKTEATTKAASKAKEEIVETTTYANEISSELVTKTKTSTTEIIVAEETTLPTVTTLRSRVKTTPSTEDYSEIERTTSFEIFRTTQTPKSSSPESSSHDSISSTSFEKVTETPSVNRTAETLTTEEIPIPTSMPTFLMTKEKEIIYTTTEDLPGSTLKSNSGDSDYNTESPIDQETTSPKHYFPIEFESTKTTPNVRVQTSTTVTTTTTTTSRTTTARGTTQKIKEPLKPTIVWTNDEINATSPDIKGIYYNYVPVSKTSHDDITEENVPAYLRLTVKAPSWKELCGLKEDLRSAIIKMLKNGTDLNVTADNVVFLNLKEKNCAEKMQEALENPTDPSFMYLPVNMFLMDKNGDFDKNLSEAFLTLWGKDGLDFEYTISKVDFVTPIVEPSEVPDDTPGGSVVAAIVISCVAGVCVILLGILFVIMKRRQKRFNYGQRCTPVSLDAYSLDSVSIHNSVRRKGIRASKRSYGNAAFDDPEVPSHSMNFAGLANFSSDKEQLYEEFNIIPQVSPKTDELPVGAETKNRYANVIPLPETRVHLTVKDGDNLSDYINANYVRGPKGSEKLYIACQAPMEATVEDFWRMVWEQNSKVIIQLTDLQENGVEKCADYLPPNEVTDNLRLFGDFQITLKKRDVKEKYIISHLKIKNMEGNLWREVTHLWYLGWPEQGVPSEANSLIAFLIEARSQMKTQAGSAPSGPAVVHCSPGTGRTGTVIACDLCIREFEQTRMVDIPKCVFNLRRDRAGAVQTKDQYAFIYQVLNLYATKLTGGGLESI